MDLQSPEIHELLAAKVAARASFKKLEKTGFNPHFKSNYSTLNDIMDACSGALAEHDLDVCHQMYTNGNGTECVATLYHKSGQYIRSALPLMGQNAQQLGSAVTYMRRYTLQALLGLEGDPSTDDDGNSAAEVVVEKITSDPTWVGPLAKTKLVAAGKDIHRDIRSCSDIDELRALRDCDNTKAVIKQMKEDLPHLYDHEPDDSHEEENWSGLKQAFTDTAKELEEEGNGFNQ